jgi:polyisoprenoid-binding protein YceI
MLKKIFAVAILLSLVTFVPVTSATEFSIDSAHSTVGFSVPIFGGISKVKGKFTEFAVTINYDEADVTKSSVTAVIKAESVDTGIAARDEHLRKPDFFDVEKFPQITFQSKRVEKKGEQLLVHGTFTMHGVSKEITLTVTMTGKFVNPENKKVSYGFSSTLKLNRRDYGITFQRKPGDTLIGDEIEIELALLTQAPA